MNLLDFEEIRREWRDNGRFDAAYWMDEVISTLYTHLSREQGTHPGDFAGYVPSDEPNSIGLKFHTPESAYRENYDRIFGKK